MLAPVCLLHKDMYISPEQFDFPTGSQQRPRTVKPRSSFRSLKVLIPKKILHNFRWPTHFRPSSLLPELWREMSLLAMSWLAEVSYLLLQTKLHLVLMSLFLSLDRHHLLTSAVLLRLLLHLLATQDRPTLKQGTCLKILARQLHKHRCHKTATSRCILTHAVNRRHSLHWHLFQVISRWITEIWACSRC